MKKLYVQPNTESVFLNLGEQITWGDEGNPSNPYNTGDAKQFDSGFLEDLDSWNTDPWETNYNLWDEEE